MTILTINMSLVGSTDTTAPVLSSLTAAKVGAFGWLGGVSTDEDNGTLFYVVTQNATETAATVKAGASQSVTQSGTQALSGSGLLAETSYRLHVLHRDAAGNDSAVSSSASFTTDAVGSGSGTVTIQTLRRGALQVAPEGVFFRASVSDASVTQAGNRNDYDPSAHLCTYLWTFGDPGRQSDKAQNVLAAHNDLNTGRGKEIGHSFVNPGTYTVTCTVYGPNGLIGVDSTQITVGEPDTAFPTTQTILVNAAGTSDTNYPGATVVTNINAAEAEYDTRNTNCRILLKRGETFDLSNSFLGLGGGNGRPNFYLGAYGSGARPIVNRSGTFVATSTDFAGDFVMTGLDLRGGWNSLNETGSTSEFIRLYTYNTPRMSVINDCVIDGAFTGIYVPGSGSGAGKVPNTHICNTTITGWGDYAVYGFGGVDEAVSIEGCAFIRKGLDWEGGSGSFSVRNSQGPIRINNRMRLNIRVTDFFSKCSWTLSSGIPGEQPCLRLNTGGNAGHYSHVDRCALEGGAQIISYDKDGSGNVSAMNSIIERSTLVSTSKTTSIIDLEGTGQTFRNNIVVVPNMKRFRNWSALFNFRNSSPATPQAPVNLHNNTIINYLSDSNRNGADLTQETDGSLASQYTDLNIENNVIWTPNATGQGLTDPQLTSVDMVTVGGSWVPRWIGHIWSGQQTLDASYATPGGFMKDFRPAAGSPLIDAATGLVPYDDFYGTVRSNPDRGAVEH